MSTETRFRVEGMDCAACVAKIDTLVRRLPGVEDVAVSLAGASMTVHHDGATAPGATIAEKVRGLGYLATPVPGAGTSPHAHGDEIGHYHDHGAEPGGPWWTSRKGRLTIAAGLATVLAWGVGRLVPEIGHWAFVAAMLVGLVPVARRALAAAKAGMPFTIESLMTIAAIGAVLIGAGEEAAVVVFLFLVGELLEGVAATKARASISGLTDLLPATALVETAGEVTSLAASSLAIGTVILVRPGDRVAADGNVLSGESTLDEAPITGESVPVAKKPGDRVFAGTINGSAALRVEVTAAASDNTIARIVHLVEEAQQSKAPTERFIDRFARFYTPGVLVVGTLVAAVPPLLLGGAWHEWIYKGLAVLLIGCPCALVISTPAAIASALSNGARRGLLLKGGAVLERLRSVTTVALDKTGTLTEGRPRVTDILPGSRDEDEVLRLASALEQGSSHPLALAILAAATGRGLKASPAEAAGSVGGEGVTGKVDGKELFLGSASAAARRAALPPALAQSIEDCSADGKTVSVLVVGDEVAGAIAMRDEPRPDALAGLRAIEEQGAAIIMLTGDNRRAAEAVGQRLGIAVRAELMPQDKQRIVQDLQAAGQVVAKVGDGVNDAPALAAADVGIAMGGGTDVALETADAAILNGHVADIAAMIDLSRRTMANIRQNITIALGLKAAFLVTTVVGITGLWPAILADTGATVLVTANAMRLLWVKR